MKYLFLIFCLSFGLISLGQDYETNSIGSNNFPPNDYDTTDYSKIPIIKTLKDCFHKSYVYYFSVAKNKFRVVHLQSDSFPQVATVQKFVTNKWENRIEFHNGNKLDNFYFKDVNNDGVIDIVRKTYFDSEIYLFKPSINNFVDSVCGNLNYDVYLIDTLHNIYCDFQSYRQNCGNIFSTLYTFKNYTKYYLYNLELDNCDDEEHLKITKLILSKCINGNLENLKEIKTYKLRKPLNVDQYNYFDNKKFWKGKYKQLLGYS